MVIFHSYVKLPEGKAANLVVMYFKTNPCFFLGVKVMEHSGFLKFVMK